MWNREHIIKVEDGKGEISMENKSIQGPTSLTHQKKF